MKLDHPSPRYRKIMVPWYDSEIMCLVVIILLLPMVLLGLVGIRVAGSTQEYQVHLWMPVLLTVLSVGVIFSIIIRIIRRYLF